MSALQVGFGAISSKISICQGEEFYFLICQQLRGIRTESRNSRNEIPLEFLKYSFANANSLTKHDTEFGREGIGGAHRWVASGKYWGIKSIFSIELMKVPTICKSFCRIH